MSLSIHAELEVPGEKANRHIVLSALPAKGQLVVLMDKLKNIDGTLNRYGKKTYRVVNVVHVYTFVVPEIHQANRIIIILSEEDM